MQVIEFVQVAADVAECYTLSTVSELTQGTFQCP